MPQPRAYSLALKQRSSLQGRYKADEAELHKLGCHGRLTGFLALVAKHTASTNMSVANCVRFLESGRWLNIYEATAAETGKTGRALIDEVRERIPKWFSPRRDFEQLLRFRQDTHYAAVNLGGPGATRYGDCCVVFDVAKTPPMATCFGGDSLRTTFDASGKRILANADVLSLLAPHDDLSLLAVVRHTGLIKNSQPAVSPATVRAALEDSDSLIEIHFHGPILRAHVRCVIMARRILRHLWELTLRYDRLPPRWSDASEYDVVPFFKRFVQLVDRYSIPLMEAEDT